MAPPPAAVQAPQDPTLAFPSGNPGAPPYYETPTTVDVDEGINGDASAPSHVLPDPAVDDNLVFLRDPGRTDDVSTRNFGPIVGLAAGGAGLMLLLVAALVFWWRAHVRKQRELQAQQDGDAAGSARV